MSTLLIAHPHADQGTGRRLRPSPELSRSRTAAVRQSAAASD